MGIEHPICERNIEIEPLTKVNGAMAVSKQHKVFYETL